MIETFLLVLCARIDFTWKGCKHLLRAWSCTNMKSISISLSVSNYFYIHLHCYNWEQIMSHKALYVLSIIINISFTTFFPFFSLFFSFKNKETNIIFKNLCLKWHFFFLPKLTKTSEIKSSHSADTKILSLSLFLVHDHVN